MEKRSHNAYFMRPELREKKLLYHYCWLLCVGCACTVSGDPSVSDASDGQTQGIGDSVTLPPMTEENTVGGETVPADTAETEAESTVSAPNVNTGGSAITDVGPLEMICSPDRVHNVTTAIYVGYEVMGEDGYYLTFQTVQNHVGLAMTEQFETIYYPMDTFSASSADIPFEIGKTYLLLLHRYRNVYADGDYFQISGDLLVQTDDFENATLNGRPLETQVAGMKITVNTTPEDFIAYLTEITADHPDFTGQDYIQSNARVDIMTASPHVVTVTASSVTSAMSVSTVTIRCRVDAVQKGTLAEGAYIDVMFPLNADVELGQTLIVTLNDPLPNGTDWYMFSCKEAMYPLSELNDILSIIREISEDE